MKGETNFECHPLRGTKNFGIISLMEEIKASVLEGRIIAIIRGFAPDVCLKLSEAYARGGIKLIEVTFNQKSPETWKDTAAAIRAVKERFAGSVRVGAGTVLTEEQLDMCEQAGGEYMITPNVNPALIRECVRRRGWARCCSRGTPSSSRT